MKKNENIVYSTDDNYTSSEEELGSIAKEVPPEK